MVEIKVKAFPLILTGIFLFAVYFRVWHANDSAENLLDDGGNSIRISKTNQDVDDIFNYFNITQKDGILVAWAHKTNSLAKLQGLLRDSRVMMIEADVRMNDNVPVLAHDMRDVQSSDLTLQQTLTMLKGTKHKGIKLDFKTTSALVPSFEILNHMGSLLKFPIFINADILRGPKGVGPMVDAKKFFNATKRLEHRLTLSLGWTTGYFSSKKYGLYTQAMVDEMVQLCKGKNWQYTFPVRASLVKESVNELKSLLRAVNGSTLTLWLNEREDVTTDDLFAIRQSFSRERVFYDLPRDLMSEFLAKIST